MSAALYQELEAAAARAFRLEQSEARLRAALEEIVNPNHEPPYRYSDAHEIARRALAKEGECSET